MTNDQNTTRAGERWRLPVTITTQADDAADAADALDHFAAMLTTLDASVSELAGDDASENFQSAFAVDPSGLIETAGRLRAAAREVVHGVTDPHRDASRAATGRTRGQSTSAAALTEEHVGRLFDACRTEAEADALDTALGLVRPVPESRAAAAIRTTVGAHTTVTVTLADDVYVRVDGTDGSREWYGERETADGFARWHNDEPEPTHAPPSGTLASVLDMLTHAANAAAVVAENENAR